MFRGRMSEDAAQDLPFFSSGHRGGYSPSQSFRVRQRSGSSFLRQRVRYWFRPRCTSRRRTAGIPPRTILSSSNSSRCEAATQFCPSPGGGVRSSSKQSASRRVNATTTESYGLRQHVVCIRNLVVFTAPRSKSLRIHRFQATGS